MVIDQKLRLLVVIINYKTPDLISGALKSLENQLNHSCDRVVVVDNFSDDGSVEYISDMIRRNGWEKWAELISSPINGGFSAGNNVGIKAYKARHYMLLNSDAYVKAGAISRLLRTMDENPDVGIIGPALIWENGENQKSCFNNATPLGELVRAANTGPISRLMSFLAIKEVAIQNDEDCLKPDWISFACVMIRGRAVKDVGLMDEKYFMYYEDNDYSRMTRANGWDIRYEPSAQVVHLNKGYSNKNNVRFPAYVYRSRSRYFTKFYGRFGLLLANLCWIAGWSIARVRNLFARRKVGSRPYMFGDIWIGFWQ